MCCCVALFGSWVPDRAAIYCGDGELLRRLPEQLTNERGIPTNGSDAHTPSGVIGHGTHLPLRGLQRFGRRINLRVKTGLKLSGRWPHGSSVRQKLTAGIRCRIAGRDVREESTSGLTGEVCVTLPDGAVIGICSQSRRGQVGGVLSRISWELPPLPGSFCSGATLAAWGAALGPVVVAHRHPVLSGNWCSVVWRRCWHRKTANSRTQTTDNGKQNTYFSSLDNMVAQGNVLPVLYGECVWGRGWCSGNQHGRRRGRWSGCGDWSLMQNVLCETASGRFCRLWSVTMGKGGMGIPRAKRRIT